MAPNPSYAHVTTFCKIHVDVDILSLASKTSSLSLNVLDSYLLYRSPICISNVPTYISDVYLINWKDASAKWLFDSFGPPYIWGSLRLTPIIGLSFGKCRLFSSSKLTVHSIGKHYSMYSGRDVMGNYAFSY